MPVTTQPKAAPEKPSGNTQNKGKSQKSTAVKSSAFPPKSSSSLGKATGKKCKNISDGESGHDESDKEMVPQMTKAQYDAFMLFQKNEKKKTSTQQQAAQKALKAQQDLGQLFLIHLFWYIYY